MIEAYFGDFVFTPCNQISSCQIYIVFVLRNNASILKCMKSLTEWHAKF